MPKDTDPGLRMMRQDVMRQAMPQRAPVQTIAEAVAPIAEAQAQAAAPAQPPAPAPAPVQAQAPAPAQAQPPAARPPAAKPLTVPKASTINQAARLIDTRTLPMATIDAYRRMKGVNEVPRFISSVELASLPPA
jgi:hypothetical protein